MRGDDEQQLDVFSYVSPEQRIPQDHPLRPVRNMADEALRDLKPCFSKLYAKTGRPSIAPEKLLRALLLQVLYSVRSERMLMEQLNYNLLFRWFVGLNMDDAIWDATVFSKNRQRLLAGEKRSNDTHFSTTDPDAMQARKSSGSAAVLAYRGHLLTENRNGLVVSTRTTQAYGAAERDAAMLMVEDIPGK